ncbi:YeeE/YedE family protein [Stappia sp. F7233]|uniref:YeeE/YedE family protein n=1 Tax=Stappia albiluteola TaxID=2758565 RepID=A0A839AIZ1_9HYPH|nr:YeeE/YedE family protein [Stappia albiluteola]MBA5778882.1 YeeE/YedE family protein [Stappia albiluteola]
MRIFTVFAIGLLFGLGIIVSGMANPAKVLNFFDVAGTWDPSLAFVMGGALAVTAIGYRFVFRMPHPFQANAFALPAIKAIDLRLVGGAAVFGVGWGLSGFCPGGVIPALGIGRTEPAIFVAALVVGMMAAKAFDASRSAARHSALERHDALPEN